MSIGLNIALLRKQLENRFAIALSSGIDEFDGGSFSVIRPSDLEVGNGFSIVVARTHRRLEASFKADNFSAKLLRSMAETDGHSKKTFQLLLDQARLQGLTVYLAVNGVTVDSLPNSGEAWRKFELDVTSRLASSNPSVQLVSEQALVTSSACLSMAMSLLSVEETIGDATAFISGMPEGALMAVKVNRYERSPANRAACIAHFGLICQACGFDFQKVYGELGEGFVEVHHRIPVSMMGPDYFVNPLSDLVPLCSNCHSMVHKCDPPLRIEVLSELISQRKASLQLGACPRL
jgi:5-methylcytosine-specific restriction protein A